MMSLGIEESVARRLFDSYCENEHKKHTLKVPGLLINPLFPHIAASRVVQICDENYHIYLDSNGDMRLKHSSPWYFQIQCQ